jgi:carboxyl-terminal processing protease
MRFSIYGCARLALALAVFPAAARAQTAAPDVPTDTLVPPPSGLKEISDFSRDETESNITFLLPRLLEYFHYSHHPFDAEISGKFLDRYLDSLDHWHLYFLQSDLQQFDLYRATLPELTLRQHDFSPATVIFSRFLQRAAERIAYATNLLRTETFQFTNEERFIPNRHTLPNPANLEEAHQLWREELRYEYLDEKLKAADMAVAGPASFDAQSNVVILLPLEYTNSLSANATEGVPGRTVESIQVAPKPPILRNATEGAPGRTVASLLPGKLLDQERHVFGSITPTPSNVIVRLQISPAQTLRKITNSFYSEDGQRLGGIRFLHSAGAAGVTNSLLPLDESSFTSSDVVHRADTNARPPAEPGSASQLVKGVVEVNQKDAAEIARTLTKRYAGMLKNYNDLTNDDYVLEGYLTALAHAYDPHSDYMGHASTENFNIQMHLSLTGIGAQLLSEDGECKIDGLVPEGPAEKSGQIAKDDIIKAVAQKDQGPVEVTGMPLLKVVGMIRGPKGTPVTLTILKAHPADPSARQKTVTLVRDVIKLEDQQAKAMLYETPASSDAPPTRIGVINLASFYADTDPDKPGEPPREHPTTTKDVARIITRLKQENVDGIILDLRRNGGGYLEEAIRLTGLFSRGPVVQTRDPDRSPTRAGRVEAEGNSKPALYDGPLIVLTSRLSASASEIVAGALQDYGRALIVGDKATFGKGTVQSVLPMSNSMTTQGLPYSYDPGSLKVTIKKFYRAGGSSTQSNGVASDIVLPSELNYAEVGESALPNPMPWDEVTRADGLPDLNLVKPYLPELLAHSLQRRETDKDFAYRQEDIDLYRKTLADKSISLDEAERLAEQKAAEARNEARKKERASRPKSGEKVYEITMKNVDLPGLHPPDAKPKPPASPDDDADPVEAAEAPLDPAADPALTETRRIMADYISLLKKPLTAAAAGVAP